MDPMQNINEAADALNQVAVRVDGFVDGADAQVGQVAARYNSDYANIYVDQAVGDDANAGTADAPVATVYRAQRLVPPGAYGNVYVRGNYTTTNRYFNGGKNMCLYGMVGAGNEYHHPANEIDRPTLSLSVADINGYANVNGFAAELGAHWNLSNFKLQMPSVSGLSPAVAALPSNTGTRAMFNARTSSIIPIGAVILRYSNITVPADPFGTLLSAHLGHHLELWTVSLTRSLAGLVHPNIAAGTPREDVAHFITTTMATL